MTLSQNHLEALIAITHGNPADGAGSGEGR